MDLPDRSSLFNFYRMKDIIVMRKTLFALTRLILLFTFANSASAATSSIGILVFDGFLTSDVTAPIEVLGAASKKPWFSSYNVVVVSATREKTVISEEGLRIVADKTIYDDPKLAVLIVPSSYKMDGILKDKNVIDFIKKTSQSASWMARNCSGAAILGQAAGLDGKRATTWCGGGNKHARFFSKTKRKLHKKAVSLYKTTVSN